MTWSLGEIANAVTIATALFGCGAALRSWLRGRRAWDVRQHANAYSVTDVRHALRWYVEPDVLLRDPSHHEEPAEGVAPNERKPLFVTLDAVLGPDSPYRYVLLLGDSGTGKTSALINYYARFLSRRRPCLIALAPLNMEHAIDWIRACPDKNKTLLLLDALDEYVRPDQDVNATLHELARETSSFAKVIISCRSQYFTSDNELPFVADVGRRAPRSAGVSPQESIHHLYIAPLSDRQIRRYIRKRFTLGDRRRARRLVQAVPKLSARPMLLSFLEDMFEADPSWSIFEIYDQGVAGWLLRESQTDSQMYDLERFSSTLAVSMWTRQTFAVSREEGLEIARTLGISIEERRLSGRSLLNRDGAGRWKFAHRSIMEFLAVKEFCEGVWTSASGWTDQMNRFLIERLRTPAPGISREGKLMIVDLVDDWLRSVAETASDRAFAIDPDYSQTRSMLEAFSRILGHRLETRVEFFSASRWIFVSNRDLPSEQWRENYFHFQSIANVGRPFPHTDTARLAPNIFDGVQVHCPNAYSLLWNEFGDRTTGDLIAIPIAKYERGDQIKTFVLLLEVPANEAPVAEIIEAVTLRLLSRRDRRSQYSQVR